MMGNKGKRAKRESKILWIGEREGTEMRREKFVGFKRGQRWLILTHGLNQHMGIFGYGE